MVDFWNGLKHSSAFLFGFGDHGEIIQADKTDYILYEASVFPFVIFEDELKAINDYCYTVFQAVRQERQTRTDEKDEAKRLIESGQFNDTPEYTSCELMMGLDSEEYKWEWLSDITIPHMVILLYSFLEKTVKYVYKIFREEKRIEHYSSIKKPKLYKGIYGILDLSEDDFKMQYPEIFRILEEARRIRNNFAHDNLEGIETESDYAEAIRKPNPSFRLIDLMNAISVLLYEIEEIYTED